MQTQGATPTLSAETARLRLRPLSLDDVDALSEILGDPAVMQHSIRGVLDREAVRAFIETCQACYRRHGTAPLAVVDKASGELAGFCGVGLDRVDGDTEATLGYRLARPFWHRGLAVEAARAVLDDTLLEGHFSSVVALIEPDHQASIRVAEKVGFGDFRLLEYHNRPVRLYRMNAEEWCRRRRSAATGISDMARRI
ncbi:GNAT family N-acetyltransferase [Halomonas sp. THAF12]|uniref:GNAT family N-acetyltransferase n=1 Tax=Halomonas sp. B23F22_10 TaxID=3459515 RepID=UPI00373F0851